MLSVRSLAVERQRISLTFPDLSNTTAFRGQPDPPTTPDCDVNSRTSQRHSNRSRCSPHPLPRSRSFPPAISSFNTMKPDIPGKSHDPMPFDKGSRHSEVLQNFNEADTEKQFPDRHLHIASEDVSMPPRDRPRHTSTNTPVPDEDIDVEKYFAQRARCRSSSWLDDWSIHPV